MAGHEGHAGHAGHAGYGFAPREPGRADLVLGGAAVGLATALPIGVFLLHQGGIDGPVDLIGLLGWLTWSLTAEPAPCSVASTSTWSTARTPGG